MSVQETQLVKLMPMVDQKLDTIQAPAVDSIDNTPSFGLVFCALMYGSRFPEKNETAFPSMIKGLNKKNIFEYSTRQLEKTAIAAGGLPFEKEWMTGFIPMCHQIGPDTYTANIKVPGKTVTLSKYLENVIDTTTIGIRVENTTKPEGQQPYVHITQLDNDALLRDSRGEIIGINVIKRDENNRVISRSIRQFDEDTRLHVFHNPKLMQQEWEDEENPVTLGGSMLISLNDIIPKNQKDADNVAGNLVFRIDAAGNGIDARNIFDKSSRKWYGHHVINVDIMIDGSFAIHDINTSEEAIKEIVESLPNNHPRKMNDLNRAIGARFLQENAQGIQRILGDALVIDPTIEGKSFELHYGILPNGKSTIQVFDFETAAITLQAWAAGDPQSQGKYLNEITSLPTHPGTYSTEQLTTEESIFPLNSNHSSTSKEREQTADIRQAAIAEIMTKFNYKERPLKPSEQLVLNAAFRVGLIDQTPTELSPSTSYERQEIYRKAFLLFINKSYKINKKNLEIISCQDKLNSESFSSLKQLGELIYLSLPKEAKTKYIISTPDWEKVYQSNHIDAYHSNTNRTLLIDMDGIRIALPTRQSFSLKSDYLQQWGIKQIKQLIKEKNFPNIVLHEAGISPHLHYQLSRRPSYLELLVSKMKWHSKKLTRKAFEVIGN